MSGTTNIPCGYLLLRKGDKVAFVLRQNTGFQDGDYGLVAGHAEASESFKQCVAREAYEEAGITTNTNLLKHVHTAHRYQSAENIRIDVYFETTQWQGDLVNKEPHKHAEIAWLDLNNLPENVQDFTAQAVQEILKGNSYSEYGWHQ